MKIVVESNSLCKTSSRPQQHSLKEPIIKKMQAEMEVVVEGQSIKCGITT